MPLTRIRTDDLLSGSVANGTLNATALTGQSSSTAADDNDLILIYDNTASGLRKMTRANFTAGLTTTLSGAYDAGRFITASNGAVDIQETSNTNAPTELLRLVVSGNVSGTASGPRLSFHVPYSDTAYIGAAIDGIKSQTSSNNSTTELQFSTSDDNQTLDHKVSITTDGLAIGGGTSSVPITGGGPHAFYVSTDGEGAALTIKNINGNVGIGTIAPNEILEVAGDGRVFIGDGAGDNRTGLLIDGVDATPKVRITAYDYGDSTGLPMLLQHTGGGYVGIGSSTPSRALDINLSDAANYALEVNNTSSTAKGVLIKVGSGNSNNHQIVGQYGGVTKFIVYWDGDVANVNNSYGTYSDIKIKENIQDAGDHYLDDLMKARVRKYSLKENQSPDPTHIGMIAQELEEVFPGLVSEKEEMDSEGNATGETIKTIKMSVFVPILIKSLQTLTKRVEALENGD